MSPDESFLIKLLRALADVRLEAIVVGTGAAAMQGVPIMTEDVVPPTAEQAVNAPLVNPRRPRRLGRASRGQTPAILSDWP